MNWCIKLYVKYARHSATVSSDSSSLDGSGVNVASMRCINSAQFISSQFNWTRVNLFAFDRFIEETYRKKSISLTANDPNDCNCFIEGSLLQNAAANKNPNEAQIYQKMIKVDKINQLFVFKRIIAEILTN